MMPNIHRFQSASLGLCLLLVPAVGHTETGSTGKSPQSVTPASPSLTYTLPAESAQSLSAQLELASLYEDQGQLDAAAGIYRQILIAHPGFTAAYNDLARILAANGNLDDAIDVLEAGLSTDPVFDMLHKNLRRVYLELARRAYQKALNEPADAAAASEPGLRTGLGLNALDTASMIASRPPQVESSTTVTETDEAPLPDPESVVEIASGQSADDSAIESPESTGPTAASSQFDPAAEISSSEDVTPTSTLASSELNQEAAPSPVDTQEQAESSPDSRTTIEIAAARPTGIDTPDEVIADQAGTEGMPLPSEVTGEAAETAIGEPSMTPQKPIRPAMEFNDDAYDVPMSRLDIATTSPTQNDPSLLAVNP